MGAQNSLDACRRGYVITFPSANRSAALRAAAEDKPITLRVQCQADQQCTSNVNACSDQLGREDQVAPQAEPG